MLVFNLIIASACTLLGLFAQMEKGPILLIEYYLLTREERQRMDRKTYYKKAVHFFFFFSLAWWSLVYWQVSDAKPFLWVAIGLLLYSLFLVIRGVWNISSKRH